ncbi:N-terminal alpha/beta hydrolase domain protein [Colletotrichum tofieldiae]|nr:N-terminal alpha/beta hydrolase domain protein [Colletotrichum tofieldiae]GKT74346.1 N-terminal alpha/beta hydrolase domain protein [Colletotrichum tofieldiae]
MTRQQDVEFKTVDGVTLRGRIFPAADRGPGVVMCPGFNGVKEMVGLPTLAEAFQQAGITALTYDPRSTGLSDGEPRNDIDPFKQVADFSDAMSFLANHPSVDRARLGYWGMSLAGATALCAASLDTRARFVIGVCPASEYRYDEAKLPSVLKNATKDRESRVKGNAPFYVPMLNEHGDNPAGFNLGIDKEYGIRLVNARDESLATRSELAPNHLNRTTLESYVKLLMWHPSAMWKHLHSTPVLYLVPELDQLVLPEVQKRHFELLPGPKRMHIVAGRSHLDVLEGETAPELTRLQIEFTRDALDGKVERL